MSGSDNMSAWRVLLHPRRAARELEALCNQVCEAAEERASYAALKEEYETRLRELASLRERENADSHRRESDLKSAVAEAQMRIAALEREKDHWDNIEAQLHDLEQQIDKALDMKKRYERHIHSLHEQLRIRDAQTGGGEEVSELLDEGENKNSGRVSDKSLDSDWLRSLPDDI